MRNMRLAVGIPTFQEADSIENVVRQVDEGLARLRDPADCVIVNVDSDSPDGTSKVFLNTPTRCRKESFVITEQPRGKGRNVLRFFERCVERQITALAIVDGDLISITPDWIESLLTPVLRGGADYVTPLYLRHRFDGSMTNHSLQRGCISFSPPALILSVFATLLTIARSISSMTRHRRGSRRPALGRGN